MQIIKSSLFAELFKTAEGCRKSTHRHLKMMRGFRYWILFIATAAQTLVYSNRIVFGFTVICQEPDHTNGTITDYYLSDTANKAWMFTATAIGMCFGPIPLYWGYKFSTNHLFFIYGLLSTLTSLLYPLADSFGFAAAFVSRFFAGFCQGSQLYFSNEVVLKYSPASERSLFFSILLSCSQIGPLFTMILGGEMCSTIGWEYTYYVLAFFTFLSTLGFCYFYSDDVENNRFCSEEEKAYIQKDHQITAGAKREPVPYRSLLLDAGIWASFVLFAGYYVGMITYQQYSPTFIKQVLNYTVRETGYFSAIPMIFAIIVKVGLGRLIDHGMGLGPKWRLAGPLSILEVFSAISMFLTGFVDDRRVALFFDMLFASLSFFVPVICSRSIQIIAGKHAHFAMNLNMFVAGFIQILLPGGIQLAVPDNTRQQWSLVFYFIAVLAIACTVLYVLCTDAQLAKWAEPKAVLPDKVVPETEEGGFAEKFEAFPRISHKIKQNKGN